MEREEKNIGRTPSSFETPPSAIPWDEEPPLKSGDSAFSGLVMMTWPSIRPASKLSDAKSQIKRIRAVACMIVLVIVCGTPFSASAKDLSVLQRISYAAFLADQGSAVCAGARLNFSPDDTAAFRNSKNYAQWIKQRVIAGLSADEVRSVLVPAADRAKAEAREAVRTFRSEADLLQWCTATVAPLARDVVGAYLRNRGLIEEIIQRAKSD